MYDLMVFGSRSSAGHWPALKISNVMYNKYEKRRKWVGEKSEATRSCKLWKRGDRQELARKTIDT